MPDLHATLERIEPIDPQWMKQAEDRQARLTKPAGSLGALEALANRMAAIQRTLTPAVDAPTIVVFAADHGVCAQGVSAYPQSVTAQMVLNFLHGGAAINALARVAGAGLMVVDMGVASELPAVDGLLRRPIAAGTQDFCRQPAMSRNQALASISAGVEMADACRGRGSNVAGIGEMGIGNTTSAAALTAALTGSPVAAVVGRGAGAGDACLARKLSAVERALALHRSSLDDPLGMLACIGGFEIGAMCGFCLGAAANRSAVLVDGFISTAAAALAIRFRPAARDYLFPAHRSAEPGHRALIDFIGRQPLLDLGMRLGEGTGAALAIPILRAAVEAFTSMATFHSAGVATAVAE